MVEAYAMSDNSRISWTDATWNPVTGCTKVSPGCAHCYAEAITLRFKRGGPFLPGKTTIQLHPDRLDQPLHWRKPRRIFVCSMSDLFHEDVPDEFIWRVLDVACLNQRHIYQYLTKRPQRMLDVVSRWYRRPLSPAFPDEEFHWPLRPNIWLGVSVENQYWADRRIPLLAEIPAAVRFVSAEPLLKPLNLYSWLTGHPREFDPPDSWPTGLRGDAVNWVIIGGESGPGHRPMEIAWVQDIADQCRAAGVPVWIKQDSGLRPGQQGRIPDALWKVKELPRGPG